MRLTWLTDIHLEFPSSKAIQEFARTVAGQNPDKVLITGDIANASAIEHLLPELQEDIGKPVLFVLGNHDFYGGSLFEVRDWASTDWLNMQYVHGKIVEINRSTCIVGVDGMADGRLGSPQKSNVILNDWNLIEDMVRANCLRSRKARIRMLGNLGLEEAETLREPLKTALGKYDRVFLMTHVPPWKEATWHEGKHSDPAWLPWFSCKAVGDCIEELSAANPGKKITVLCGHTHGSGYSKISEDIEVYTGAATYYLPEIQLNFDIFEDGSYDKVQPKNSWEASSD